MEIGGVGDGWCVGEVLVGSVLVGVVESKGGVIEGMDRLVEVVVEMGVVDGRELVGEGLRGNEEGGMRE